ncbi:Prenyltransferase and squalene oxidase repeat protein [Anatilimnocola aggregata]|uniref:Prenyltransferase and squalene oxidase repeat protein n=1 Tax=Anatilimnocola aggregata TaxID=2528021 RepID=A0A517YA91_9BACT|nr:prenyltransferase/squalene oxidase repeat-containing protein [Anatilimnocola aggregata]QDU27138.1 Prenyltransferase and squalene oxidase repeat protein [Anatilimnocola aggregata]
MHTVQLRRRLFLAGLASAALMANLGLAQEKEAKPEIKTAADQKKLSATVAKAIEYLKTKGQAEDGSFSKQAGIGVTALAVSAMLQNGLSPQDPAVAKGLKFLESNIQPGGGIHSPKSRFVNYETCLAVMTFSNANKEGKYDKVLNDANKFLKTLQFDGEEGHDKDSASFGGGGYGAAKGRPDLSNTAFMVEALRASGASADDQAIQNALIFVSRCQNLESPHNTTPYAALVNDGGFYYTGAAIDESKELAPNGGLRSYGTMTYAGLKSLIFAGVKEDDPRVKAAVGWIGKNYDLKSNPGMGSSGLFYYYQTFAKSLDTFGNSSVKDAKGVEHDWRKDLVEELASRQRPDGAWVNENGQWMEGDANLCTCFALLALSHCKGK